MITESEDFYYYYCCNFNLLYSNEDGDLICVLIIGLHFSFHEIRSSVYFIVSDAENPNY